MTSSPSDLDTTEFIRAELTAGGVNWWLKHNDFSIPCPFLCGLDRRDYKQKLQIHYSGERVHCWVCKTTGNWNKVADQLGLRALPSHIQNSLGSLERELNLLEGTRNTTPRLPPGLMPFEEDWRGISAKSLEQFETKLYFDALSLIYRPLWPVSFNGAYGGWVAGYLEGATKPTTPYRNNLKSKSSLFGVDTALVRASTTIVLVEGPYDCIRLQSEGIPAVAILGTGGWSRTKALMLTLRSSSPTDRVIVAFDGDEAGDQGRILVWPSLTRLIPRVELFDLPEGKDPGNCSLRVVEELRAMLLGS